MDILTFGKTGWGDELFYATLMTIAVSITAMLIGFLFSAIFTPLKLSNNKFLNLIANSYTTGNKRCSRATSNLSFFLWWKWCNYVCSINIWIF